MDTLQVPPTISLERETEREETESVEPALPASTDPLLADEEKKCEQPSSDQNAVPEREKNKGSVRETRGDTDDKEEESESEIWDKIIDVMNEP